MRIASGSTSDLKWRERSQSTHSSKGATHQGRKTKGWNMTHFSHLFFHIRRTCNWCVFIIITCTLSLKKKRWSGTALCRTGGFQCIIDFLDDHWFRISGRWPLIWLSWEAEGPFFMIFFIQELKKFCNLNDCPPHGINTQNEDNKNHIHVFFSLTPDVASLPEPSWMTCASWWSRLSHVTTFNQRCHNGWTQTGWNQGDNQPKTQRHLTFTGHIAALSQHWKIIHGNPTKIICQVKLQQWKMFLKDEDELQLSEQWWVLPYFQCSRHVAGAPCWTEALRGVNIWVELRQIQSKKSCTLEEWPQNHHQLLSHKDKVHSVYQESLEAISSLFSVECQRVLREKRRWEKQQTTNNNNWNSLINKIEVNWLVALASLIFGDIGVGALIIIFLPILPDSFNKSTASWIVLIGEYSTSPRRMNWIKRGTPPLNSQIIWESLISRASGPIESATVQWGFNGVIIVFNMIFWMKGTWNKSISQWRKEKRDKRRKHHSHQLAQ